MRTETVTRTLYTFRELSEKAQERAISRMRRYADLWHWQHEYWDSAKAFGKIAPITIESAEYDNRNVGTRWTGDEDVSRLAGVRAWKWLHNNGWLDLAAKNANGACTLTGYIGDCALFDPIHKIARTPETVPTLRDLFDACAESWINDAANDMEHAYSDEAIAESLEANEAEFDEYGNAA